MSIKPYFVIGIMSGTSLDGVDLVYVKFNYMDHWEFEIINFETIPYSIPWKRKLSNLVHLTKEELDAIDVDYTNYLAGITNGFMERNSIKNLDAIASHGHTALHRPDLGYTVQIGNRKELAQLTKQWVVCDFRVQDVKLGGQGAPLVPIGDELLFSHYGYCLNLGGFANISTKQDEKRIAYDLCPVNIVLNKYAEMLGKPYDENGDIAAHGTLNSELLSQLNALPFYSEKPPKSLGLEWVNTTIFPLLEASNETPETILRTFTEHIAIQVAGNIHSSLPGRVLVTGGGAYNSFLIRRLSAIVQKTITIPAKELVEYKEALIFGLLGVLRLRNEINCLSSVTGAKYNHSSGVIYEP